MSRQAKRPPRSGLQRATGFFDLPFGLQLYRYGLMPTLPVLAGRLIAIRLAVFALAASVLLLVLRRKRAAFPNLAHTV